MNKKYFWLKLKENFFDEKQIKYLRSLPDGDKLVITYLKMQLKSLRTEGFIKYDKIMPSNLEELSMILDEDINIIKLTINALIQVKAIEILDDGSFYMIAMQELIGKEGSSAERVRKFRERQKASLLQCNGDVTKCNTEIEIEIDKDKEIDIDDVEKEKIKEIYEQNFGKIPVATAKLLFSYLNKMDYRLIIRAIELAVISNKKSARYINGILKDWSKKGFKNIEDIKIEENNIKSNNREYTVEDFEKLIQN